MAVLRKTFPEITSIHISELKEHIVHNGKVKVGHFSFNEAIRIEKRLNTAGISATRVFEPDNDIYKRIHKYDNLIESIADSITEADLIGHIVNDMANDDKRLIYAKWLIKKKDPRGSFLEMFVKYYHRFNANILPNSSDYPDDWLEIVGVRIIERCIEYGWFDQLKTILGLAKPRVNMWTHFSDDSVISLGSTKFGGMPDLTPDIKWPMFDNQPQMFLGQINLSDLCKMQISHFLPSSGLLLFFVHYNEDLGEVPTYGDNRAQKVIYISDTSCLHRTKPPQEFQIAPSCNLQLTESLDLPYLEDDLNFCNITFNQIGLNSDMQDEYDELLTTPRGPFPHLLGYGHPSVLAGTPTGKEWQHLATFSSDEKLNWCWEDGYFLFYNIKPEALVKKDFNATEVLCG